MSERGERREPERRGTIFLIYKDGKVLVENRVHPQKDYFGYFIIPGGKVNFGESFEQGVTREIGEECGIIPKELIHLDSFLHVSMSNHLYETAVYLILDYSGEVVNKEGKAEHVWLTLDEARQRLPFSDSRYVLILAKNELRTRGRI